MATPQIRKSSRKRPNANEGETPARLPEGPNEPFGDHDDPAKRYLRQLYQEIHDASVYGLEDEMRSRVEDILRRTRSRRFWASVSNVHKAAYQVDTGVNNIETNNAAPANFGARGGIELMKQKKLDDAIAAFSRDTRTSAQINDHMLGDLVESCGYPILSICLHSETFLQYAETSHDDHRNAKDGETDESLPRPPLSPVARVCAIESAHASLELFAKVRRLDFLTPIRAYDEDLELLLSNIFKPYNTISHRRDFGIRDGDMREIHQIDPWDAFGKHWTLPIDRNNSAELCRVTYTVTEYLKRDHPELNLDDELTEPQEAISDSVLLKGYDWPHMEDWPTDDPREHGYDQPCHCCNQIRGPVPKPRDAAPQPRACECTLKDLHLAQRMPRDKQGVPRDILFEIAAIANLGNGIRTLQNIHEGDLIGIYVGEMYPRSKFRESNLRRGVFDDDDPSWIGYRYGSTEGMAYLMDQHMAPQRHRKPARGQRQGPPKGEKKGQKKTKRRQKSGEGDDNDDEDQDNSKNLGAWIPLDPTEYRHWVIDSALRGNWTRYLNHSCDPNVRFDVVFLGCKSLVGLVATRDILFGEWMTVDYGQDYFVNMPFACKCGMENCLSWNTRNKRGETRTLAEAIKEGRGPIWAKNEETVPRKATKAGIDASKQLKRQRQRRNTRDGRDGDENDQSGEDEADSAEDAGKTHRAAKRSKAAAEIAQEAQDASKAAQAAKTAAEQPLAPTRRSERQRQRQAQRPEPEAAPGPARAKKGTKRSASSTATGAAKKQKKR